MATEQGAQPAIWRMRDFTITLVEQGDGTALVHANTPDHGETPSPLPRVRLQELGRVTKAAERTTRRSPTGDEFEKVGRRLGDAILCGPIRRLYDRASADSLRRNEILRVLLKFGPSSSLQCVPWELLHDGYRFLSKDPCSAVVRSFVQDLAGGPLAVQGSLRVLVTSANPSELPRLDLEVEEKALRLAYEDVGDRVQLTTQRQLSSHGLMDLLLKARANGQPFHVWHHCGHGGFPVGTTEFALYLESDQRLECATVRQLCDIVGIAPELRAVVLNCCHSASLLGLAPELSRLNVPVVVGFPSPVADDSAIHFAAALHQCWLDLPIEIAVSLARRAMRPGSLEWSQPLLFSRRSDSGPFLLPVAAGSGRDMPQERMHSGSVKFRISGDSRIREIGHIGSREVGGTGTLPPTTSEVDFEQTGGEIGKIGSIGFERIGSLPPDNARASEERFRRLGNQLTRLLSGRS